MKKRWSVVGLAILGLLVIALVAPSTVAASEEEVSFLEFGVVDNLEENADTLRLVDEEVISPTEFVQTYVNEDGVLIEYSLDTSEATFFDENGNELTDKPEFVERKDMSARGLSGGSWQTGSGYSVCTGMKVSSSIFNKYYSAFKVNFELNQSSRQGRINSVYGTEIQTYGYTSYSWTAYTQIFRAQSTTNARAYAGHKIQLDSSSQGTGSTQVNNFFQIKGINYSQTGS